MKKILIVDDEESILKVLSKALRRNRVEVITTSTIEQAEFAIRNAHFDVVLADIRLTGVLGRVGLELLSYVEKKSPGTKVIIMTGYGTPEVEEEAYEKGAFRYFDKPIDLTVLMDLFSEMGIYDSQRL